jgi:hypothetical protein
MAQNLRLGELLVQRAVPASYRLFAGCGTCGLSQFPMGFSYVSVIYICSRAQDCTGGCADHNCLVLILEGQCAGV